MSGNNSNTVPLGGSLVTRRSSRRVLGAPSAVKGGHHCTVMEDETMGQHAENCTGKCLSRPEPETKEAWDDAWRRKSPGARGRTAEGRRSMLWNGGCLGTVLLVEPESWGVQS